MVGLPGETNLPSMWRQVEAGGAGTVLCCRALHFLAVLDVSRCKTPQPGSQPAQKGREPPAPSNRPCVSRRVVWSQWL